MRLIPLVQKSNCEMTPSRLLQPVTVEAGDRWLANAHRRTSTVDGKEREIYQGVDYHPNGFQWWMVQNG